MQEAIDTLNVRVINVTEQTLIDALETCIVDHNKTFIDVAQRSALNGLFVFISNELSVVRESFEICYN